MKAKLAYLGAAAATMVLGLSSRAFLPRGASFVGDILWAVLLFFLLCAARPFARSRPLMMTAVAISVAVETCHLVDSPVVDAIRENRLGRLVIGRGFAWSDLGWYAVGIVFAACLRVSFDRQSR